MKHAAAAPSLPACALPWPRRLRALLATLLLVCLSGCSSLRLGYDEGPRLARWWLDRQFDFDPAQKPRVQAGVDEFFAWHRRSELMPIADLLGRIRASADGPLDGARVCGWQQEVQARLDAAFEHALPALAELAPTLAPAQLDRFERRLAERLDDDRKNWLPASAAKRRERAFERALDRSEDLYGRLDRAQRRWLDEAVAALPSTPEQRLDDRARGNAVLLATLRRIAAERPAPAETRALLRARWDDIANPADPARAERRRNDLAANCALIAALHDRATPAQRRAAADRLAGWELDARELARSR
ncbi:DUF6279 family lipoprotein [Derxia lacustris]|uniref:DUF6279 family lipoprotein n=1 Tax=Derxia lacustris TaxID=764842 RepID=UPI000A16F27B|nr:DUF6279 family lipoprotein [Derxia lacustris]